MNTLNSGISFSGGAPLMEGTWYNPKTGDSFTVRDTFFENNELIVFTTDGRRLNYNTIERYVKSDKPIPKQENPSKNMKLNNVKPLPKEVEDILDTGNSTIANIHSAITTPKTNDATTTNSSFVYAQTKEVASTSENYKIIEKALSKSNITPELSIELEWDNFPIKEIELLKNIMDIPEDEITDYIVNYFDTKTIINVIKSEIISYIDKKINKTEDKTDNNTGQSEKSVKTNSKINKTTKKITKKD